MDPILLLRAVFQEFPYLCLCRVLEEGIEVDIVHQHDSDHCGKAREAPFALDVLLQDHQ